MEKIELINYIKTPVSSVYEALTTERGLSKIWTTELIVKPAVGFVNEFGFGDNLGTKMEIMELIKNKKILWKCIDSDPEWIGTSISFDLSDHNGATAVVLRHFNWRELTEFYQYCNYNWAMFLFSLKLYCEEDSGMAYQERMF